MNHIVLPRMRGILQNLVARRQQPLNRSTIRETKENRDIHIVEEATACSFFSSPSNSNIFSIFLLCANLKRVALKGLCRQIAPSGSDLDRSFYCAFRLTKSRCITCRCFCMLFIEINVTVLSFASSYFSILNVNIRMTILSVIFLRKALNRE